jgi:hypothetical protein
MQLSVFAGRSQIQPISRGHCLAVMQLFYARSRLWRTSNDVFSECGGYVSAEVLGVSGFLPLKARFDHGGVLRFLWRAERAVNDVEEGNRLGRKLGSSLSAALDCSLRRSFDEISDCHYRSRPPAVPTAQPQTKPIPGQDVMPMMSISMTLK